MFMKLIKYTLLCLAFVVSLTALAQDPLDPAKKKIADGVLPTSFSAYVGASSGESLDNMSTNAQKGEYSYANQKRYYSTLIGPEPAVQIGYAEQSFNIAEGINRGWATGNAETFYNEGVKASMLFFGVKDGAVITITESDNDVVLGTVTADVTAYLNQATVKYLGNNAADRKSVV